MNTIRKLSALVVLLALFGLPSYSHAQQTAGSTVAGGQTPGSVTQGCDPRTGCPPTATGFKLGIKLNNPLKVSTIQEAIKFFLNTIMKIALPFIVVFFIWSGLKFILARGNPKAIEEAKNMFLYTIIGTLLILGAWAITNAIIGTVNTITS